MRVRRDRPVSVPAPLGSVVGEAVVIERGAVEAATANWNEELDTDESSLIT